MKSHLTALIFAAAIVLSAIVLGKSYVDRKKPEGTIEVTGLGTTDFSSDLVVWEGSFSSSNILLKQAYESLEADRELVQEYLISKGVSIDQIIFGAVISDRRMKVKYSSTGNYMGEEFDAYFLTRSVRLESSDIEKVEKISREITELLNKGVNFYSSLPRYYYTQLANLKIDLISSATEDARTRAEKIALNSGAELGSLVSARMGVFQITGQNSTESYSWGGTFNTADRDKTASITMKLRYKVK